MNIFISHNIKYLCEREKLTQNEFGDLFDLGRSVVSMYVSEKSVPKLETILAICRHFDISIDSFVNKKLEDNMALNGPSEDNGKIKLSDKEIQNMANRLVMYQDELFKNKTFNLFFEREVAKGVNEELKAIIREQQKGST